MSKDLIYSFLGACGIHGLILFGLGMAITESAEFGVAVGQNSVEVDLVAAPPSPVAEPVQEARSRVETEPAKQDEMVTPEPVRETPPPPPAPQKPKAPPPAEIANVHGDSNSARPGQDETTLQSSAGVQSETKPGYLKNPTPPYPEQARRMRQEGVVLLAVLVNVSGEAESVEVKRTSTYSLLDEAAVKTVKRWRFRPAQVAGAPTASQVEIPVRFQLKEKSRHCQRRMAKTGLPPR